jgi:hypothetical protein
VSTGEAVCEDEAPETGVGVKLMLSLTASAEPYAVSNVDRSLACQYILIGGAYAVPHVAIVVLRLGLSISLVVV